MRIPLDDAIMSCAEVAEHAYAMLLSIETEDEKSAEKLDKICGMLAVLVLTLDELPEHVHDEIRLQSLPSETQPAPPATK